MQKTIFHNIKHSEGVLNKENLHTNKEKLHSQLQINKKNRVDINTLLNRVKMNQKNEQKQKVIFFGFGLSLISLMGTFILIIR